MPIKIPDRLPAANVLRQENIFVMPESRALRQDIRPLKVLILNLMPLKIETETQFLRLLSNTPLQVDVELLRIDNRPSRHTPQEHLDTFYRQFDKVRHNRYDGMIVTGAPLGQVDFQQVLYWEQIKQILDWSAEHVTSTLFVCWAVQAGLYHFYGLDKRVRREKLSGVYRHRILAPYAPLLRGFDDEFMAPHSRFAEVPGEALHNHAELTVLAESEQAGWYLAMSENGRQVFVSGHPEYDTDSLHKEYVRDLEAGIDPRVPVNYYPGDDPSHSPLSTWRSHGSQLFSNWINYCVYQHTTYRLDDIGRQIMDDEGIYRNLE